MYCYAPLLKPYNIMYGCPSPTSVLLIGTEKMLVIIFLGFAFYLCEKLLYYFHATVADGVRFLQVIEKNLFL